MRIKWLTKDYIQQQAEKGRKEALFCCRKHWLQLKFASPSQLLRAIKNHAVTLRSTFCALCYLYNNKHCKSCPLVKCSCSLERQTFWGKAILAFNNWRAEQTPSNWLKWEKASQRMYDKIDKVCRRLYPAEFK